MNDSFSHENQHYQFLLWLKILLTMKSKDEK